MEKTLIRQLISDFESHKHEQDGVEFWYARDLYHLLGYEKWEMFPKVIEKAETACINSGFEADNHFEPFSRRVEIGSGAKRPVKDFRLTRYACYLIAQNGDPRKQQIAFAQTYFAVQTRKAEIIEQYVIEHERLREREKLRESEALLSKLIHERGVAEGGFARIRSKGDAAFFGGKTTGHMKTKLEVPKSRPLADFLQRVAIAGKNLATEATNWNIQQRELYGEYPITREHVKSNATIRRALKELGIVPEDLPRAEDVRKVERRLESEKKKALKSAKGLKKGN